MHKQHVFFAHTEQIDGPCTAGRLEAKATVGRCEPEGLLRTPDHRPPPAPSDTHPRPPALSSREL